MPWFKKKDPTKFVPFCGRPRVVVDGKDLNAFGLEPTEIGAADPYLATYRKWAERGDLIEVPAPTTRPARKDD